MPPPLPPQGAAVPSDATVLHVHRVEPTWSSRGKGRALLLPVCLPGRCVSGVACTPRPVPAGADWCRLGKRAPHVCARGYGLL